MAKTTNDALVTFVKAVGPLGQNIDTRSWPPLSPAQSERAIQYIIAYLAKSVAVTVASLHGFIEAAEDLWDLHGVAADKIADKYDPFDLESFLFVASYYPDILKRGESTAWGPFAAGDEETNYPESFIKTYIGVSLLPKKAREARYTAPHEAIINLAGAQQNINDEDFECAVLNAADCCKYAVKAGIPAETMRKLIEDCVADAYLYAHGGRASNPRRPRR